MNKEKWLKLKNKIFLPSALNLNESSRKLTYKDILRLKQPNPGKILPIFKN